MLRPAEVLSMTRVPPLPTHSVRPMCGNATVEEAVGVQPSRGSEEELCYRCAHLG